MYIFTKIICNIEKKMKNFNCLLVNCFILALFLSSCSMKKRLYSSGFHIEWHNRQNIKQEAIVKNSTKINDKRENKIASSLLAETVETVITPTEKIEVDEKSITSTTETIIISPPKVKFNNINTSVSVSNENISAKQQIVTKEYKQQNKNNAQNIELDARIMPVGTYIGATEVLGADRARALIGNDMAVADINWALDYFRFSSDHRLF